MVSANRMQKPVQIAYAVQKGRDDVEQTNGTARDAIITSEIVEKITNVATPRTNAKLTVKANKAVANRATRNIGFMIFILIVSEW